MKQGKEYIGVSVAFLCHDGNGNILMHQRGPGCRDHHYTWDWGGGGVEYGERLEEAVLREVAEEYGVVGIVEQQLPVCEFIEDNNHWVIHNYIVYIADPASVQTTEPEKVTNIQWFAIDALPHHAFHPGCAKDWEVIKDIVHMHVAR